MPVVVPPDVPPDDIRALLQDWDRSLRSANKAPNTIALYLRHVRYLTEWLLAENQPTMAPDITKAHLETYFGGLGTRTTRRNGRAGRQVKASYVATQFRSIQQFWAWMAREEIITANPFDRLDQPAVPSQPVPIVPDDVVRALLATCADRKVFENLRDEAMIRVFIDTGARAESVAGLHQAGDDSVIVDVDDIDLNTDSVTFMGKGRRTVTVPFGAKTSEAIRRYRRVRARHPLAAKCTAWWLGSQGPLTSSGIRQMFDRRAERADLNKLYPHLFRHLFAHVWQAQGGSEGDLMRILDWKSERMPRIYAESSAAERAQASHRRMRLGDRF